MFDAETEGEKEEKRKMECTSEVGNRDSSLKNKHLGHDRAQVVTEMMRKITRVVTRQDFRDWG